MNEKKTFFQQRLEKVQSDHKEYAKKSSRVSTIRLISFLFAAMGLMVGVYENNRWYSLIGAVLLIIFFFLVYFHSRLEEKLVFLKSEQEVLERYICRFSKQWQEFEEDGREYLSDETFQAKDLDLLGRNSLYQLICTAGTVYGKDHLARFFTQIDPLRNQMEKRQQAVKELSNRKDFVLLFQTLGNLFQKHPRQKQADTIEAFLKQSESEQEEISSIMKMAMKAFPIVAIASLLAAISGYASWWVFLTIVIIELALSVVGYKKIETILSPLYLFQKDINAYEKMFETIEQSEFQSDYLKELQIHFKDDKGSHVGIKKLDSIGEAVKVKYNPLLHVILCSTLLWDYQTLHSFEKWKKVYGKEIRKWLEAIGEIEALMSLCVLGYVKESVCFPHFTDEKNCYIQTENMKHALIDEKEAIGNSLIQEGGTCIITGSNMSGKTTFLRSIGVNVVLAYAGGSVCADHFSISSMSLFTSIRIEDDISKGVSTFYAEILRIKKMVEFRALHHPMLVLIDEIFTGTNSADRIIGATETIRKLSEPWVMCMVTTHDFELCRLSEDENMKVANYHFEEYYMGDDLHFDYKIRLGQCKTTNAKHLLRMAGIISK